MVETNNLELEYEVFGDRTNNLKEAVINLFRVKKKQSKANKYHKALDGLNLKFSQGERVGIIGRNGAGKSTFLKVISGILKPTGGEIRVGAKVQPLIELGAGFDMEISGRENIYLNSYMLGFTKEQVKEKENEIIEFADIGNYIDTPVKYYSSGMLIRLAFTIATSIEPEILVIDEMLGAGDIHFIRKAEKRLHGLIDKAKVVVIVSHDMDFLRRNCKRLVYLKNGKVVADGFPDVVIKKFENL